MIPLQHFVYIVKFTGNPKSFYEQMSEAIKKVQQKSEKNKPTDSYKPRYNGRVKKRQWEDYGSEGNPEKRANFNPEDRVKRRKWCLLLGYCGANYYGMQRNPDVKTIEGELLVAMLKYKWITEEGFNLPQQIQFQRAARTDKGVSAARQCVSMKLRKLVNHGRVVNKTKTTMLLPVLNCPRFPCS